MNAAQICTPVKVPEGSLLALFCSLICLFSEHLRDIQITSHSSFRLSASFIYQYVSSGRQ